MLRCHVCQTEVGPDFFYCPNCGTRLLTPPVHPTDAEKAPEVQQPRKRSSLKIFVASILIIFLIMIAAIVVVPYALSVKNVGKSTIGLQSACPTVVSSTTITAPVPDYDEQQLIIFAQSYNQLAFNVTAIAQCDANGYGPAYLLNGLTNNGYWFQVGISWNWPLQTGGYSAGFGFASESWAPGGLTRAVPVSPFTGLVNSGDVIEITLSINSNRVLASALDLNTSATDSTSYPARSATTFVGSQAQKSQPRFSFATQGYFSGLMTEWYHVTSNYTGTDERSVVYSESTAGISSGTLGVGEWNFTTNTPTSVFSAVANNGNPIDFTAKPDNLQTLTLVGFTLSADSYEFETG
jgi:hypothetical protein